MKFLVIKDLDATGQITTEWLSAMTATQKKSPEALKKDYAKLVESLARLNMIESALRKEVLHLDDSTQALRETAASWLPVFGGLLTNGTSSVLNLAAQIFMPALAAAMSKQAAKI